MAKTPAAAGTTEAPNKEIASLRRQLAKAQAELQAATAPRTSKRARVIVLQPGRGKRTPEATAQDVMAARKGYYNHRRIAKGEKFTLYTVGEALPTWCVPVGSAAAKRILREVADEAEANKGRKTKLPSHEPSLREILGAQSEVEGENVFADDNDADDSSDDNADGGGDGAPRVPVGDEDEDEDPIGS